MPHTAIRTCPLCEATCGLELTVDGERVTHVRGDADDVFSGGYLCPKGALYGELEADPDRLTTPRVRRDGELVAASWDEAFADIADRLPAIQAEHGPDAVAIYLGNPNVHNLDGQLYARPLIKALRTRNVHTATSVDQLPKHVSSGLLFGDPLAIPVPDIDRTDLLVMLGANPRVSNGSLMTAPDLPGRLTALQRRGRLVVVDPKRTRTADRADQHLPIVPGTDAAWLAALATTLAEEELIRPPDHLDGRVEGIETVVAALAPLTPEAVAPACGIDAQTTRQLARELAATPRACVYGRLGTTAQRFGSLTSWLVDVVNLLSGHLDTVGGAMFPQPAHHRSHRRPFRMGRWHSRVRGLPETMGELPVATLIDEITTPGDGQVRTLITVAGNPVLSTPDSAALDAAIGGLDLVVSVDPYLTATSRHADVVLPPPPTLHRPHYDLSFTGLAVRNVANYSPPAVAPDPDRPDEWEILLTLAAISLGQRPPVDTTAADTLVLRQAVDAVVADPAARVAVRDTEVVAKYLGDEPGPDRFLDLLLRAGPYGDGFGLDPDGLSLEHLRARPHGVDLGALQPRLPAALRTDSGHVHLAPDELLADLPRLLGSVDARPADAAPANVAPADAAPANAALVLIGRRHLRTNNSWSHNLAGLAKGQQLCTLQVHPDDAAARGLHDGARARVTSTTGAVEVDVELCDRLHVGVVSLPHGFGHDLAGVEQSVARRQGGANSNVLTDRRDIDAVCGNAVLNGIPVEVAPA